MSKDTANHKTRWIIRKYESQNAYQLGEEYETKIVEDNILLNEGIALMWDLFIGGSGTAFDNATSYIGVGDGTTAAVATQTGLQGTNKAYAGMASGYPQRSGQKMIWRAVFDGDTANHDWREFTVANSNSDAGVNLNRKVDATQGTKGVGQTWTLDLEITLS